MSPEAWSAIGTVGAAFAAVVAVYQTKVSLERQQVQNHKAVIPVPQIVFGDYVDHLFVKLENAGVGPMTLIEVQVRDHCAKQSGRSIIGVICEGLPNAEWVTFVGNIDGRAIVAGDSLTLIEYRGTGREYSQVRTALSRLTLTVNYTDVYENKFKGYSRNFAWFGRNAEASEVDSLGYPQAD